MGVSNDAKLYFGFPVGDEGEPPEWMGEHEEFEDYLAERAGMGSSKDWEALRKMEEACPADLFMHCHYSTPMYVLGVRGAEHRANRGYATEITSDMLVIAPERISAFKMWCDESGIEWRDPKWLLCSMNG